MRIGIHLSRTGLRIMVCAGLFAMCGMTGCERNRIMYAGETEIDQMGWAYGDSVRFAFTAGDTTTIYDLWLEIEHGRAYEWENAYVKITTEFPGDSSVSDIVSLELSDGAGGWLGRCRGESCRLRIPLQRRLKFPRAGEYALTFIQYMRRDVIPGIYGLKLTVEEAEASQAGKKGR